MKMNVLVLALIFFILAVAFQRMWINFMLSHDIGEAIKNYGPKTHLKKRGTPGMGGMIALCMTPLVVLAAYWLDASDVKTMAYIWAYPVISALVGLADDLLKIFRKSSEGLRSLQKLCLQIFVTVPWACAAAAGGVYLMPWLRLDSLVGIPLLTFLGVGILNAVNVTDGLDGLAGGSIAISLVSILFWAKSDPVVISSVLGLALLIAFLWHNSNPAEVFMGDVGSHFWAGLLLSLCVTCRSLLYLIPAAFIFGVEILTVAIQIAAIRGFDRRVFKMSPLHHHFELLGWGESRIVTRFWMAHVIGITASTVIIYSLCRGGGA
ncbi:MAG: phospho-N-acetylmuramoyl-pentapeptide-transferase [Synergistaceae bacterium]|jgi:phospho-N-acetylmuramoyl-pentapeptide-transferase|nr:phospho-N-acetylmuramoyl-pentapeptide-transferase [Synergistaceae bacterium]